MDKENEEDDEVLVRKQRKDYKGESTLEKQHANINVTKYDLEFDVDPLF